MSGEPGRRIVVGITGASGALYAVRTVAALLSRDCQVELVVSDFGRRLLRDELGVPDDDITALFEAGVVK